ncbi:MAG TPA: alpha-amylase family glycosyl hydrolase [Saprospiraceae bacterium]|nr:alpha-amylase family glycosyl hydrolase [Saprospiraceae bacterium]
MKSNSLSLKFLLIIPALLFINFLTAQNSAMHQTTMGQNSRPLPFWARNAVIYEVNLRQYTPEGTIKAFATHLPRLKEMGIDIIWLMPIFPIGFEKRKGTMGSYYAASDYKAINPEFGTMEDFDSLVSQIHNLGMKVILDWTANHTAYDHIWVASHPDYYYLNDDGKPRIPLDDHGNQTDWTDVADLNYNNPELRSAMSDAMMFWIDYHRIDGFRCDMAFYVPLDFWQNVKKELDKKGDYFMLAESERPDFFDNSFQVQYGWTYHHLMKDIAQGRKQASALNDLVMSDAQNYPPGAIKMQFIDNHDENSWNKTMLERFGPGFKVFALLNFTMPGIPLMYSGQEADLNKSLRFFEKDTIDFGQLKSATFYRKLIQLHHDHSALWSGVYGGNYHYLTNNQNEKVYSFSREDNQERIVIIANLSAQAVTMKFTDPDLLRPIKFLDFNSNKKVVVSNSTSINLAPWESKILIEKRK